MAYNKLSLKERLLNKIERRGDCWIWIGTKHPRGWGNIRHHGKWMKAYRASYEVHHGQIPEGNVVMHSCDNPSCINPEHLSLGTQHDNVHDMLNKGRANPCRGENHPKAKLTATQVTEIRARYQPGKYRHGAGALAREYGVSKPSIQAILAGQSHRESP